MDVNFFIKRLYTLVAIWAPVLNVYGISASLNTFTMRELAIILILILCCCFSTELRFFKMDSITVLTMSFLVCLTLSTFFNSLDASNDYVLRVVRCMILYTFVLLGGRYFFDYDYGLKVFKFLAIFASIIVIAQVVCANYFSYPLKGYLSFLPIRSSMLIQANMLRRFYSIFEEPGYFGMICSGYFLISIFMNKKEYITLCLIAIAGLLTTATTSIVCLAFVVMAYLIFSNFLINKNSNKQIWKIRVALLVVSFISICIFINSAQYDTVVHRLMMESSTKDRFVGYDVFFDKFPHYTPLIKIFGNSMQEYPISGFVAIIMAYGILGTIILLSLMILLFLQTHYVGKILLLYFLFLNIGNVEFMGNASTLLCFFGFILSKPNQGNLQKYQIIRISDNAQK